MNMLALVALGRVAERLVGTPKYALMILILGVLPMLLACLIPIGKPLEAPPSRSGSRESSTDWSATCG